MNKMVELTPGNIDDVMWQAVRNQNETQIKEIILTGMSLFLNNKISKEHLDILASIYMIVPIHEPKVKDIEFVNLKLKYVLEKLSAIEVEEDGRAILNVKRFIAYLKGEDYETIQ